MSNAEGRERRVIVWDLPTRIFHWSLVILIVVAWFTGEEEGGVHMLAGSAIAGLLVFRLFWGIVGGEHARFSDFAVGPNAILAHVRDLFSARPHRHLGHNPLGGVAVLLMLGVLVAVVGTGLFSGDDQIRGPFASAGRDFSEVHELAFRMLQALVVIHILGVVFETFKARDPLVPAMVRGWKPRRAEEAGSNAKRAPLAAAIVATLLGVATSIGLMMASPAGDSASYEQEVANEHD
ncbi:MAG: cytochrome b/b6 domain-containing protein [Hyphomonadaceae bacterium]